MHERQESSELPERLEARLLPPKFLVGVALAFVLGGSLVAGLLSAALSLAFGAWMTEVFLYLGVSVILVQASGRDARRAVGLVWPGWRPVVVGLAAGFSALLGVGIPLLWAWGRLFSEALRNAFDQSALFRTQETWETVLIVSCVSLAAPLCEEYFFRGVIQNGIQRWKGSTAVAVVVTSLVFAAFHLNPIAFPSLLALGLLFGVLLVRTGSLWPSIAAHAANNLTSSVLYFLGQTSSARAEETAEATWQSVLTTATIGWACLAALAFLVWRSPIWLPRRPLPDVPLMGPEKSLGRLALPWAAGAAVLLGVYLAFDHRGVALNLIDLQEPYPGHALPEDRELRELRRAARRGEVPIDSYRIGRQPYLSR